MEVQSNKDKQTCFDWTVENSVGAETAETYDP
jgi:hypothetical protein